jgi:RNA polymerase sigma factor (sigma-70 family)
MDTTLGLIDEAFRSDQEKIKRQPLQVEHLYSEHYDELKVFLMSRARDKETVEVILQDIYLRLIDIEDLSVIQTPSAYLNRLASNLLIDHQRWQARQLQRLHDKPVEQLEIAEQKPSLAEQAHYTQQLELYEKIVGELPPPAGEILTLHRVDGLTHSEIAKKFGKSKSWVEKTIAKTLLHCRKLLQESGY